MRPIKHENCNGWAIYDRQYIDGEQSHNIHAVETFVIQNQDGTFSSRPNCDLKTRCGVRTLKKGKRSCIMASTSEVDIRNKLAELQNSGREVCGQCVATFYADGDDDQ